MTIAHKVLFKPGPKIATITMAKSNEGIERITSRKWFKKLDFTPFVNADNEPIITPITKDINTTIKLSPKVKDVP